MTRQRGMRGILGLALWLASGCGGDGAGTARAPGAGGSAGSAGAVTGGAAGSAGSSTTGVGGSIAGVAGSGGAGVECSGAFGAPTLLFTDDFETHSLSLTADDLELFYLLDDPMRIQPPRVVVRTRGTPSEDFSSHVELPELDRVCGADRFHSMDVSPDGLRLYFACTSTADPAAPQPVRLAERPSRDARFVIATGSFGATGGMIGISHDELTLFASGLGVQSVVAHSRSALGEPFGESQVLLSTSFRNPEPTEDGLGIFGVVPAADSTQAQLVFARRDSLTSPFGAPSADGLPQAAAMEYDASPAISADCRTLYFLRIYGLGTAEPVWTVQIARR